MSMPIEALKIIDEALNNVATEKMRLSKVIRTLNESRDVIASVYHGEPAVTSSIGDILERYITDIADPITDTNRNEIEALDTLGQELLRIRSQIAPSTPMQEFR